MAAKSRVFLVLSRPWVRDDDVTVLSAWDSEEAAQAAVDKAFDDEPEDSFWVEAVDYHHTGE